MNAVVERPPEALAVRTESATLTQAIIAAANDPTVNVEKMERLLSMHERIAARDAEQQFNAAMVAAQSGMGRVSADAVNPQTRSRYATYAQLDRTLRPVYTANGFSLSFNAGTDGPEGYVRVVCYVSHSAGHTRTYQCDMPADGKGAKGNDVMTKTHASGSAMSYGMRYLLKLIFNVAIGEDDDDGNDAGGESLIQQWASKVAQANDEDALRAVMKDGVKAFQAARDRAGYAEFAKAVKERGAALKTSGGANA
ncbi:MAG: ERF family protein [Burkholderiales bacterium]|nr:ERF family protein [Burkholderiales bacterium]